MIQVKENEGWLQKRYVSALKSIPNTIESCTEGMSAMDACSFKGGNEQSTVRLFSGMNDMVKP